MYAVVVDWTLPVGTVLTVGVAAIGLVGAFFAFSWSVQRAISEKFAEMQLEFTKSLAALKLDIALQVTDTRSAAMKDTTALKDEMLRALTKTQGDHHDVAARVQALEAGQSEWTKTLRARSHDLANHLHALETKVELIACGVVPRPRDRRDAD